MLTLQLGLDRNHAAVVLISLDGHRRAPASVEVRRLSDEFIA
jgi:hypothetical protein